MVLLALVLSQGEVSLARVQDLVDNKDAAGLAALTKIPGHEMNPFNVLKTGGPYGVGRYGWKAIGLDNEVTSQRFVVLSTPLTSQDVGEIVLRRTGSGFVYVPERDSLGIKLNRHSFDLRFLPAEKKAELTDRLTVTASAATSAWLFRMSPSFRVSSVRIGTKKVPFSQAGGVVVLPRAKGKITYTIKYGGVVDLPDYAGSISAREATLTNDYWYPMIARQPAPYEIGIRAPKDWSAVGQGEQVSTKVAGEERVTRYRMDLPVVYYSVSAAPYKTVTAVDGNFKVWTRSMRMSEDRMALQPALYSPILNFYQSSFAPYPFSAYGALDSEVYGGGALEAYSFATYGGGLPSEDAHEPAHTWWGGILNNTYLGSFWNESFAVYSDGFYRRNSPLALIGAQEAFITVAQGQSGFERFPIQGSGAFVGPDASSLGYGKGALVLQMLEQLVGTDGMKQAMREWIRVDAGKAVDWPDFERVVLRLFPEQGLKGFFDDWLRKPGYARLSLSNARVVGGQVAFDLKFQGEEFRMPLEVMVEYSDGTRVFSTLRLQGSKTYSVPASGSKRPVLLSLDPWLRALRRIEENEYADEIQRYIFRFKRYTDPSHKDWLPGVGRTTLDKLPADLNGVFIVGHPDTTPAMKELLKTAGLSVRGNTVSVSLNGEDASITLDDGAAFAVVDLPGGGKCVIGMGKTKLMPNAGRAKVALVDGLGRFRWGVTEPKRNGALTAKL
ncbi:MAG TPA: hypothetical protein VK934_04505 [Fimbriimonas sp.]|nr:hypothetical protein [Fimbriimonas sp.]